MSLPISTKRVPGSAESASTKAHTALWIVQALLAVLFVFAGGSKLVMPIEEMTKDIALPGLDGDAGQALLV